MEPISESETAFLVMHDRPDARATQHRSCCKATGWTWIPKALSNLPQSGDDASGLRAVQNEIQRPAATIMWPWPAQMLEDGGFSAAGVFERIGQHAETVRIESAGGKGSLLVGGL